MVGHRHAHQFRRNDGGHWFGHIGDQVRPPRVHHAVQQAIHDLLDVRAQPLHPARREGDRRKAAQPRVCGSVQEQHLPHHDLGDGVERRQTDGAQLLRRRRAVGGEIMQNMDHVPVERHHPGMQEGIPMDWILRPQSLV